MTVATTTTKVRYTGDGTSTTFAVPFIFYEASSLKVYFVDGATGVETLKTLGADYMVSGGNGSTGSVIFSSAPPNTVDVLILLSLPLTQTTDLQNFGIMDAETIERALDRAASRDQQLDEKISRSVLLPVGTTASNISIPNPSANKFLRWKADLTGFENVDIASVGALVVSDYIKTLLDDPDAATARNTLSAVGPADVQKQTHVRAVTSGTSTAFTAAPTPAITANTAGTRLRLTFHTAVGASATLAVSGLTALPLKCKAGAALVNAPVGMVLGTQDVECDGTNWVVQKDVSVLNVKDFGAVGDGTTDDKAAIQSAINAAVAASGGIVFFPTGNYAVASGLTVSGSHVRLVGGAVGAASITATANGFIVLDVTGTRHSLENLLVYRNLFSSNPSDVLVRLNNAVQCKIDNCWLQGGFYSLAITGTNCTDNVITCSTLTFATGSALVLMQSSGGINGAHHFYRVLCNQAYPAGVPVAANYKGAWSASTAYAVKDVVTVGAYYLQCTVAGTSGNVAPAVNAFYGTNIPDNTVTWQLMGRADYRGFQIDTGVTFVRIRECDVTGPYINGINLTNTLSGSAPQAITIERCTIHGPVFNGVFVNAGKEIELLGVNTFSPTGGGSTLYGIGLAGSEQALVKDCQVYGYTQGIYTNTPRTSIIGNAVFGCNVGIYVEANLSSFAIVGNLCGSSSVRGGNTIGIQVAAGTSDRYVITNNITFGATTGVSDGGSGVNKSVTQNF
jgi:hypothetical protein